MIRETFVSEHFKWRETFMRTAIILFSIVLLCTTAVYAEPFSPTQLKITAEENIQYGFGGAPLDIPIQISGTPADVVFMVFTKDMAESIPQSTVGYLGWHTVNKVDTCIYYSTGRSLGIGAQTLTWDGKDMDGGVVPEGSYTYYIWGFDDQSSKTMVGATLSWDTRNSQYQEVDEAGLPLANPFWYRTNQRWVLGGDPLDDTLKETATLTLDSGWANQAQPVVDPTDHNMFYCAVLNSDASTGSVVKYKWVPLGTCELQTDWADGGYGATDSRIVSNSPGMAGDDTYLYSGMDDRGSDPLCNFFIYNYDGDMVANLDLTDWWSHPEDYAAGGQMNGGFNSIANRNNLVVMNSHRSCLKQLVDPYRYLDTEEMDDFYVYSNTNGDYVLDHNFEEDAELKWVCFDYNVGPYTYSATIDANNFVAINAYDVGATTFGLLAPDGTGLGYFSVAGETAGWKKGVDFVDGGTPFDGMYLDNMATGGDHYNWDATKAEEGIYYLGQDSIMGTIGSGIGVADAAPAAFSVAQNSPNPFNPTTNISFSIVEAGNVSVDVYNVAGQKVDTLVDGFMSAGSHSLVWDASNFSAGVYFYTVETGGLSKTIKMTLLK
jgi:flagellar hook assembly protein FlgD